MTAAASTAPLAPLVVLVHVRTQSETNAREPWQARHRRRQHQRESVRLGLLTIGSQGCVSARLWVARGGVVVTLTRIAPRPLDGHDNLRSGCKAIADEVAEWLGVDDADDRVTWQYGQRRGRPREYAIEIRIAAKGAT